MHQLDIRLLLLETLERPQMLPENEMTNLSEMDQQTKPSYVI